MNSHVGFLLHCFRLKPEQLLTGTFVAGETLFAGFRFRRFRLLLGSSAAAATTLPHVTKKKTNMAAMDRRGLLVVTDPECCC